jgi:APA family basic amino acid/polyamine antiporter
MPEKPKAGSSAATALVVASMIGTGVFTSLGFQLLDYQAAPPILMLWIVGGLTALCGALCYAELASLLPRSGGEYHYLGEIYHPAFGFMSGLLSAMVGFAAPTALSALALGGYVHASFPVIPVQAVAVVVILLGTVAHSVSTSTSARVQTVATALKLLLILSFLIAAALLPGKGDITWWQPVGLTQRAMLEPAFASALLYVFYAYSGWNAAVYGLEEWDRPEKTVRRALIGGTFLVMLLYVALNAAFLHAAPIAELRGVQEVGHAAAVSLFGSPVAKWISMLLAAALCASVSAMLWAGPRVLAAMGRDLPTLRWFAPVAGVPTRALLFQAGFALVLVAVGNFESLLTYTQVGLTLATSLSVFGIFILRRRLPYSLQKSTIPLYPLPPILFLGVTGLVVVVSLIHRPWPAITGVLTAMVCALLWIPFNKRPS